MDYTQFLNMLPEVALTALLIIVFVVDFAFSRSQRRHSALFVATVLPLAALTALCFVAEPSSAFGSLYVSTPAAGVMKVILTGGTLVVVIMSQEWLSRPEVRRYEGEYYILLLSTLLGMYFMMSSAHFLLFFLALEMASVPLACLVAFGKGSHLSAEAAAKFILTATFSSGVMLYGISFIYAHAGTLYFADVVNSLEASPLTIMGLVFFFSGLGFKISLVPFHLWTADTYQGAPTPVTAYLSVVSKGAAAFTLMVILHKVFAPLISSWELLLAVVIMLSVTVANLFALRQRELKRFMAFSSISQAGYIMLAVLGTTVAAAPALSYYVLVYVAANLGVFTIISLVEQRCGTTRIDSYSGFYRTNPRLTLLLTLALFSLAGIPPFAGMFSKFFVFMAAVSRTHSLLAWITVFVALINTVVSLYYYLIVVKAMYISPTDRPLPAISGSGAIRVALALCTAGIILFGIFGCVYSWIEAAAM